MTIWTVSELVEVLTEILEDSGDLPILQMCGNCTTSYPLQSVLTLDIMDDESDNIQPAVVLSTEKIDEDVDTLQIHPSN